MAEAGLLSDVFSVVQFDYRDDGEGYPMRVESYWGIVVRLPDGVEFVLYETDRRGLVKEKLHELVKLLCDPASEWRARLPQGLDAEFKMWTYAVPVSRLDKIEQRKRNRKRGLPEWLA